MINIARDILTDNPIRLMMEKDLFRIIFRSAVVMMLLNMGWMLDTGYWILDSGFWILDTGGLVVDAKIAFKIWVRNLFVL
jgi:hypothetical protein